MLPSTRPEPIAVKPDDAPSAAFDASLFASLFDAYPEGVLLVDGGGHIVLANPAVAQLLGYTRAQLIGLKVDALVPEKVATRHDGLRQGYVQAPRPRPMGNDLELTAKRADGSEVMVEIALSPLQVGGAHFVVASLRGIGAYPRVQRAMRRARYNEYIAQVGRVAVDARDPQELISCVAALAAQALEVDAMTVWLLEANRLEFRAASIFAAGGEPLASATVPNRADTLLGYVAAQREALIVSSFARENRFNVAPALREGKTQNALAVPMIDDGRVIGVLVASAVRQGRFAEDEKSFVEALANLIVTSLQRAQTEAQLAHAQRMESVGQLTGGIAHDFNNLLTIIQGNLQMLADHPQVAGHPLLGQMVKAAARAGQRGAELTSKLLAFSRRQTLAAGPVDVGALLNALADMLRRTLGERIHVVVHVHPACPPCLADAGQLESALLNIAVNSRDAMPEGGTLTFTCAPCHSVPAEMRANLSASVDAAECVAITIRDTGVGMNAAVLDRAFEPFFTTKDAGKGTGLGLSTVYGFVQQSGGHLKAESSPGAGTSIVLFLPGVRETSTPATRQAVQTAAPPHGTRVLMVEDDADVRTVALAFLHGLGCDVVACTDAERALAELQRGTAFDLLFSDITLGAGMNGIELAEHAHALAPGLAVLLTSGYSRYLAVESPDHPRQWPVLQKPYSRDQLSLAAAQVLDAAAPARRAGLTATRAATEPPPAG